MVEELIGKYVWLIQTFGASDGLTLEELKAKWQKKFGYAYSRRTFNNHRQQIGSIFGIDIQCDRSSNRYFIRFAEEANDNEKTLKWIINTFSVNNLLSLSRERLSGRVSVEDIPSGHIFLTRILEAMTENREIRIGYQKYVRKDEELLTLRPYALKEESRRWYLIAFCIERNAMRVYSLDRIKRLEVSGTAFEMPSGFDVDDLFKESFGTYLPETDCPAVTVKFKASLKETGYLEDLPIHKSQKKIYSDGNSAIFSIFASPNESMFMEFLKLGPKVEIISPEEIKKSVISLARQILEKYGETDGSASD